MYRFLVIILLSLTSIWTAESAGDKCVIVVAKKLKNGDELPDNKQTKLEVQCSGNNYLTLSVTTELDNAHVKLYFANEEKNILVAHFLGQRLNVYKYEKPHCETDRFIGPEIENVDNNIRRVQKFPRDWLPANTTRMSASVVINDYVYYNYYGIFNYDFSYRDTMVVEEYKKLKCCLTDP